MKALALTILLTFGSAQACILPPAEYDHAPLRPIPVSYLSGFQVMSDCRAHGIEANSWEQGCVYPDGGWWRIVLRDDLPKNDNSCLRHEIGHSWGWGADHAGGRFS